MAYKGLGKRKFGNPFGLWDDSGSGSGSFAEPSGGRVRGQLPPLPDVLPLPAGSLNDITTVYGNKDVMLQQCGYFFPFESLGRGSFGSVVKGIRTQDKEKVVTRNDTHGVTFYAVKQVMTAQMFGSKLRHIDMEIKALTALRGHDNITHMAAHFAGPSVDKLKPGMAAYFVLELADGGDLSVEVQTEQKRSNSGLAEAKCRFYFKQIAAGMNFMHSRAFLHRDLKLENVLLVSDKHDPHLKICKITDFGLSLIGWTTHSGIVPMEFACGTRRYMAPEYAYHLPGIMYMHGNPPIDVLPTPTVVPTDERKGTDHITRMKCLRFEQRVAYVDDKLAKLKRTREPVKLFREYTLPMRVNGMPADVWTLGVCLFAMMTGKYPFVTDAYPTGLDLLITGRFIKYHSIPPMVRDFLRQLFEPDPVKRITVKGIMYHPWINVRDPNYTIRRPRGETMEPPITPPGQVQPQPTGGAGPSGVTTSPVPMKTPSKEKEVVAEVHRQKSGEKAASSEKKKSAEPAAAGATAGRTQPPPNQPAKYSYGETDSSTAGWYS